ncbi:MAG: hypothetical protein U5N10_17010 [Gemmobacter sp.]|nr:hypothetical protein [Gemmobacter sp.]
MLRYLRYLVLFFIALCLLTVGAWRTATPVTVQAPCRRMWPPSWAMAGRCELPLFVVIFWGRGLLGC